MNGKHQSAQSNPLVSVVVPCHNGSRTLARCLDSIRRQNYRPLEVLFVDDGSDDGSREIASEYSAREQQNDSDFIIKCFHQQRSGAPIARNVGFQHSSGEYAMFLDADDALHSEKISAHVRSMSENPDWDFSYGPVYPMDDTERAAYGSRRLGLQEVAVRQLEWPFFSTPGPFYRRAFFEETGGWRSDLDGGQDWELHVRMLKGSPKFGWVPHARVFFQRIGHTGPRVSVRRFNDRRSSRRSLEAKAAVLSSALEYCPLEIASTTVFKRTAVWQLLRLARSWLVLKCPAEATSSLALANDLACGGAPAVLTRLSLKVLLRRYLRVATLILDAGIYSARVVDGLSRRLTFGGRVVDRFVSNA